MNVEPVVPQAQQTFLLRSRPRWLVTITRPGLVVGVICLLSLLLQVRFFILSDFRYLALTRVQDDSFYYLQPAWMFKETGQFTFDGETPTYGFQPLWMLLLTGLSFFAADKVAFLREALV